MSYRMIPEREVSVRRIRRRLESDRNASQFNREELVQLHERLVGRRPSSKRPVRYLRRQVLESAVDVVDADIETEECYRRSYQQRELHIICSALQHLEVEG